MLFPYNKVGLLLQWAKTRLAAVFSVEYDNNAKKTFVFIFRICRAKTSVMQSNPLTGEYYPPTK